MKSTPTTLGLMVADTVPAMLAYWDNQLICRYANESYLDWFGKIRDEMVNNISITDLFGDAYGPYEPHVSAALNGSPQELVLVMPAPGKKNKRYLQVSFFPDVEGDVVKGFVMHAADITPVKELEKQIKKSNETIKAQNKSLLNFANIVTHDLRGYTFNLEGLLELYEKEPNEQERQLIFDNIKDLSALFKTTVKNLSDVVAIQNMGDIPVEEVNLFECVNKAVEILGRQIKETGATVNIKVSPFVYIDANPAYMDSIVYNFLSNAIKYRHPDRSPSVEFSTMVSGNETILSIRDNGKGIDLNKHRHQLFGMYKTFHGNSDATGIGLFITKYQVDSMGGHIGVESQVDKGTWFRVYLKTKTHAHGNVVRFI